MSAPEFSPELAPAVASAAPSAAPHGGTPVVAVVGGGQLARMMVPAAAELGVHLRVLVEDVDSSAAQVLSDAPVGAASDPEAIRHLVAGTSPDGSPAALGFVPASVLTFEHEHVPTDLLAAFVAGGTPVHPGPGALVQAQDKIIMRERLTALGVPCPRWAALPASSPAAGAARLAEFIDELHGPAPEAPVSADDGGSPDADFAVAAPANAASVDSDAAPANPCRDVVVKTSRGGYDGKGVRIVGDASEAADWFEAVEAGGPALLVEEKVPFTRELAVLVARRPSGEIVTYPVVESIQVDGVCFEVIAPAPNLDPALAAQARDIAARIAQGLEVTGVLAVEMFEVDGTVLVNELAMRPHNSGHWTIDGAVTSQFEQHLRAVLDLPLGDTSPRAPWTVMTNLLGSNLAAPTDALAAVLRDGGARVNLYGKSVRPGRKLGHVNVSGDDLADVRRRARRAIALLRGDSDVNVNESTGA